MVLVNMLIMKINRFYSYPDKVLQFCIKNLSKYVILKTNYQLKKIQFLLNIQLQYLKNDY